MQYLTCFTLWNISVQIAEKALSTFVESSAEVSTKLESENQILKRQKKQDWLERDTLLKISWERETTRRQETILNILKTCFGTGKKTD